MRSPVRCSRFIMGLSLHTDCMELKMPTQMQAQMMAKQLFLVCTPSTKVFSLVTNEISTVMISVDIRFFHCFSFRNSLQHLPT